MTAHTHRFVRCGTQGLGKSRKTTFILECCRCSARRERPATTEECAEIRKGHQLFFERIRKMDVAFRPVQRLFKKYENASDQASKWAFMQAMHRLQKKFPEYIFEARVDDNCFAGSDLWFVSHKYEDPTLGRAYWGTSILYIGQCSDDRPVLFFAYPDSHMKSILSVVQKLDAEARRLNKGQRL